MKINIASALLYFILALCIVPAARAITPDPPANGILKGTITDKANGQTLIGVTVIIPDLHNGTITDVNGKYTLSNVPKGIYLLQVRYLGYATINQKVDFSKTSVLDFQMQESSIEASEVVITGVSKATEIKRNPIPMVAISKTFIDERAAAGNVIDEIANLPGVSAVTTGPNVSKPFIHGLGYNRVVTLEDGVRQEGQQWGDEHGIEVDQNSIDRIEVIKGPASLSYGSDAIGGVVNLITASPVSEGKITGDLQGSYGTNNGLVGGSFRMQGNDHGFVWGTVLSTKEAKDYQNAHDGRVYGTNFKENDGRIMVGLTKPWGYSYLNASVFNDQQAIPDGSRDPVTRQFTKQITDADIFRPIVSSADLNSYTVPVLHQNVQLYRIYDNSSFNIGSGTLLVNLGYQYSHRREYTHPLDDVTPGLNLQLTTLTYDVKYNFSIADYETTFGVNGQYQSNAIGGGTAFPIPAYTQFDIGPFFVIKKTFGKLDISGGARIDSRTFNAQSAYIDTTRAFYPVLYTGANPATTAHVISQFSGFDKTFTGFSGSFGATYNFNKEFLLKANISRGFRSPSIAELSANGPDPGSQIYHVGNTGFLPEFSVQEDLGAFLTLPTVTASIEAFNNNIQNYIYQQEVLDASGAPVIKDSYNEFTYVQSTARIYGGEANLDIHPVAWLHFENAIGLTYGENKGSNGKAVPDSLKYLPFIPPLHTHSELRGNFNKGVGNFRSVYVNFGFDHYSAQDRFFAAYGTETYTAGYNLISAGIGGNLVNKAGKTLVKLFIEGTNLGNVNYQSNMSRLKYFDNTNPGPGVQPGIFNMGRNVSFKLIVPFDVSPKSVAKSDVIM